MTAKRNESIQQNTRTNLLNSVNLGHGVRSTTYIVQNYYVDGPMMYGWEETYHIITNP